MTVARVTVRSPRRRPRTALLGLAAVIALLVAGCSAPQNATQSQSQSQPAAAAGASLARQAPAPAADPAASPGGQAQAGQTDVLPVGSLPLERMVIRNAKLSVQVGDVEQALARTREIAQAGGGFLSASSTRLEKSGDQEHTVADLTLQIRSDALDTTLQALRGLGKVESETSASQDVTEEYVDLDANLRNLQASESAILKLMDRAQRIEDVISLQRELTNVRGQIQRIQGRKTYLERRTDMATINLSLHLPPAETAGGWNPLALALRGWSASLAVLRGLADVLIVVAAFSWWLVPLVAAGVYVWTRRRPRPRAAAEA